MKSSSFHLLLLCLLPGLTRAQVTYVDADVTGNTTLADGTPMVNGVHYAGNATDNLWNIRTFANGGTIISSNDTGSEDAPRLKTTVSGLTVGESYEVHAYFWGAGNNQLWRGRASLSDEAGDLPGYNTNHFIGSSFSPMTYVTAESNVAGENPGPLSTADGSGSENGGYFSNSVLTEEDDRRLYQVSLGTAVADGSGEISVFIDDLANTSSGNRTWYDGVGVELPIIPDPDSDMDGLTDAEELSGSRNPFGPNAPTKPDVKDSDGDGFSDGDEVFATPPTNPNDISSFPHLITFLNATPNTTGADGNTTLANGALLNPGTDYESYPGGSPPPNPGSRDGKWNLRSTYANGGEIFASADVGSEDCPLLKTTITGLTPDNAYELYGYHWAADTGSQAWQTRFGRSPSTMRAASPANSDDVSNTNPSDHFTNSPDVLIQDGNRELYEFPLNIGLANGSGEIEIYVDDVPESGQRSWFDGVGHRPSQIDLSPGADDDEDDLDNIDEIQIHFTDPTVADTDGDNINDGVEITNGTNPLDANDPEFFPGDSIAIAPDGVWTWFNDERAIWHLGKLYSGYVLSDGRYGITRYDPATNTSSHSIISTDDLEGSQERDDHNNPSITVLRDNRLLLTYSKHSSEDYYYHRTSLVTEPATILDWGPEVRVDTSPSVNGANNTYANTYRLNAESDRIYMFHRQINFNPTITLSTDNGATWGTPTHFIDAGTGGVRPYPRYCSNNVDRIDLIYTDGHPRNENNNVYHMYYNGGGFHETDGTLIDTFANIPLDHDAGQKGTEVYTYSSAAWGGGDGPDDWIPNGRGWTWDVHYGADGHPVCVFQVQVDNVTGSGWNHDRIYYYYARWTGTIWQRRFIAQGGRGIYASEDDYGGGMSVDPDNPNVIYISSNAADPFDLSSISAVPLNANERYEIYRGVTADGGQTFTWEAITANSPQDNLRPIVPANHGYDKHALWFYGNYNTYTNYNTKVVGLFVNKLETIETSWTPSGATFSWQSEPGATYDIMASLDMTSFGIEALRDIPSQGNTTSQAFDFPEALLGQSAGFFRVEKQP